MSKHSWTFFRAGSVDQVDFRSGADVEALATLDKKLWVALACPTQGTEIDEKTLALLDTDKDARIRPPELLAAIEWAGQAFKSLDLLFEKGSALPLDALDASNDEGKAVLSSAKRILADQGKADAKSISVEDVLAMQEAFAKTRLNGDGIVPPDSAEDETLKKVIEDIVAGASVEDRSGKPGVDQTIADAFFKDAADLLAWETEGKGATVLVFGDKTAAAYDAFVAVEAKLEDFFTRCRVAAYDARGASLLAPADAELTALAAQPLAPDVAKLAELPLAKIDAAGALPLEAGLNPAWAARVHAFRDATVKVALGDRKSCTAADLAALRERLAEYRAWQTKKPAVAADKLGLPRLREVVDGGAKAKLDELIAADKALEPEYAKITLVEKATRLRRDLLPLLRNFVSFAEFYRKKKGAFQVGTLYLDARACELCVRVNDAGKHAKLAGLAKAYLAYCDCTRTVDGVVQKLSIVAAVTAGDVDNLMVGRNGVFYDRAGKDWDATITSIVENPISIRQAFWAPYKKLLRLIEEQVAKRAAEKEKESSGKVDGMATDAANADKTAPGAEADKAKGKGVDVGTVAAIGVAVAGLASFLGLIFAKFVDLGWWMPLGLIAILLAISTPSMVIAWLKLRQRNLGPILDASGWAVNTMCRVNVPFGRSLTSVRALPEGASRAVDDPYAEKPTPWALYLFLALLVAGGIAWTMGKLDGYLPASAQSKTVLAPALAPAPAPSGSAAPATSAK